MSRRSESGRCAPAHVSNLFAGVDEFRPRCVPMNHNRDAAGVSQVEQVVGGRKRALASAIHFLTYDRHAVY
jgi:hypothetical protein